MHCFWLWQDLKECKPSLVRLPVHTYVKLLIFIFLALSWGSIVTLSLPSWSSLLALSWRSLAALSRLSWDSLVTVSLPSRLSLVALLPLSQGSLGALLGLYPCPLSTLDILVAISKSEIILECKICVMGAQQSRNIIQYTGYVKISKICTLPNWKF